jgi:serine/threonine protein phosphatase 1
MSRTYAIADVHGRHDLLSKAFRVIDKHSEEQGGAHRVVLLGDFVDRGPASREIVTMLMGLQAQAGDQLIVLQGNHEAMMLEVLSDPTPENLRWWARNGGGATLASYGLNLSARSRPPKVPTKDFIWLAELPLMFEDRHRIYAHAGIPQNQPVAEARRQDVQWMRYAAGALRDHPRAFPDGPHVSGKHIVHGHEQSASHPLLLPHRTNLDSWAWKTGALAIGVLDDNIAGGPVETLWAISEPG